MNLAISLPWLSCKCGYSAFTEERTACRGLTFLRRSCGIIRQVSRWADELLTPQSFVLFVVDHQPVTAAPRSQRHRRAQNDAASLRGYLLACDWEASPDLREVVGISICSVFPPGLGA